MLINFVWHILTFPFLGGSELYKESGGEKASENGEGVGEMEEIKRSIKKSNLS